MTPAHPDSASAALAAPRAAHAALEVLAAAQRLQQQGTPCCLVTVLRVQPPASALPGDKAVVTAEGIVEGWIGGGCAQPAVVRTARQALAEGRPRVIRITPAEAGHERELQDVLEFGMACHSGGTLELLVDPLLPLARLTVVGNSPLAAALTSLAPRVGLPVTVVAADLDPAAAGRWADAERVVPHDDPAALAAEVAPGSFVVVATQGRRDLQGLRAALALRARQVFFVASARKAQVLKAALREAGHDAAAVDAIVAPAGQPIGAQTPAEIALSVLAAVVAARRQAPAATSPPPADAAAPGVPGNPRVAPGSPLAAPGNPLVASANPPVDTGAAAAPPPAAVSAEATSPGPAPGDGPAAAHARAAAAARRSWWDRIPLPQLPPGKGGCCS